MKTIAVVLLVVLAGCAQDGAGDPDAAAPPDAGPTDTLRDAGIGDACIMAQGNCGCVWWEVYNSATGQLDRWFTCPDAGH